MIVKTVGKGTEANRALILRLIAISKSWDRMKIGGVQRKRRNWGSRRRVRSIENGVMGSAAGFVRLSLVLA